MKRLSILLFMLLISVVFASYSVAQENEPISVIEKGLNAYKNKGAKAAVEAWIQGSALEGSKEALSQANNLRQIEDFYGTYEDFEIIKINNLSKRMVIVAMVLNYQNGPLFSRFDLFKNSEGKWVIAVFDFHTKSTEIFPSDIVFGQ